MAQVKPGDLTGQLRAEAALQNADAQEEAAASMYMATAQAKIDMNETVIDATSPQQSAVIVDDAVVLSTEEKTVVIRTVENIDSMTFGVGKHYSFKAGQKYEVSVDLYRHLKSKGYLANEYID